MINGKTNDINNYINGCSHIYNFHFISCNFLSLLILALPSFCTKFCFCVFVLRAGTKGGFIFKDSVFNRLLMKRRQNSEVPKCACKLQTYWHLISSFFRTQRTPTSSPSTSWRMGTLQKISRNLAWSWNLVSTRKDKYTPRTLCLFLYLLLSHGSCTVVRAVNGYIVISFVSNHRLLITCFHKVFFVTQL